MAVTQCVCFRTTFADLAKKLDQVADRGQHEIRTVQDIGRRFGCGTGCGGCQPYLQAMLDTGHTCFAVSMDGSPPQPCQPDPWDPT